MGDHQPRAPAASGYIAKAYGEPYVNSATKVMLGHKLKEFQFKPRLDGYAIKVPVFSFDRFPNVDKSLGPEMKSTGEAIYYQGFEGRACPARSRGVL